MSNERNETDPAVSRAYREMADERAPERLDEPILKQASKAVRPRYARSRAWTRPLAWAATIALSVAVVMELTRAPAPNGPGFETAAPSGAMHETNVDAVMDIVIDAPAKTELKKADAEDFRVQDKDMLRRADELAELQQYENVAPQGFALRSTAPGCPEEATRDPATWLACIEQLEEAGQIDEAKEQRRLLIEAFPDFELP